MHTFQEYHELNELAYKALVELNIPLQEEEVTPLATLATVFADTTKFVTDPLWIAITRLLSKLTLKIPKTDEELLISLFAFCKTNTALFKNSKDGSQVFTLAPDIQLTVRGDLTKANNYKQVTIMINGNQKITVKKFNDFIDLVLKKRIKNNLHSNWDNLNAKLKSALIPKILAHYN